MMEKYVPFFQCLKSLGLLQLMVCGGSPLQLHHAGEDEFPPAFLYLLFTSAWHITTY